MLKDINCQPTILYLVNIPFINQDEINTFPPNKSFQKFITSTPELKKNTTGNSSSRKKSITKAKKQTDE